MLSRPVISECSTQRLSRYNLRQGRRHSIGLFAKAGRARSGAQGIPQDLRKKRHPFPILRIKERQHNFPGSPMFWARRTPAAQSTAAACCMPRLTNTYRRDVLSGDQRAQIPCGRLRPTGTSGWMVIACHTADGGTRSASPFGRPALFHSMRFFTTAGISEAIYDARTPHGCVA
jgi:hypothetical protein